MVWLLLGGSEGRPGVLLGVCYCSPYRAGINPFEDIAVYLQRYRCHHDVMLLGDFNARCGNMLDVAVVTPPDQLLGHSDFMHHHLEPVAYNCPQRHTRDTTVNAHGRFCIELCQHHNLILANGRVNGDLEGRCSYHSDSREGHSMIDLFLVSPSLLNNITSLVVGEPSPLSDHCTVVASLALPHVGLKKPRNHRTSRKCYWDQDHWMHYASIISSHDAQVFIKELVERILSADKSSFSDAVSRLCSYLARCTVKAFKRPPRKGIGAPWWDSTCSDLKQSLYVAYLRDKHSEETKVLRKAYRRLLRSKELEFSITLNKEYLELLKHKPRLFWSRVRDKPGLIELDDPDHWCDYFDKLLNVCSEEPLSDSVRSMLDDQTRSHVTGLDYLEDCAHLNDPITCTEVLHALRRIPNAKASADGFIIEVFKYAREQDEHGIYRHNILASPLCAIFNRCFAGDGIPQNWHKAYITPLYKGKGSKGDMNNYRGLTVTCTLYKIYAVILNRRLDDFCEMHGIRSPTQCGFRRSLGTSTGLFALQHAIHRTCCPPSQGGQGQPLFTCFIDFRKAFDIVVRDLIWARLDSLGIRGKFAQAVQDLYSNTRLNIKIQGKTSKGFVLTTSGVKQGCPLSPTLFGLFIEQLHDLFQLRCPSIGVIIVDETHLPDILYADDVLTMAPSHEELQSLITCLEDFCSNFGMQVNTGKTEVVVFCPKRGPLRQPPNVRVTFKDVQLTTSSHYSYLGARVHQHSWLGESAKLLAISANRALMDMLSKCRYMNMLYYPTLLGMFDILVEPVGSYACQIWAIHYFGMKNPNQILNNPFQKTQIIFLRMISGCNRSTCRWSLLREFGYYPIQMKWICHTARHWNKASIAKNLNGHLLMLDIALFQRGNKYCWVAKFLNCMHHLGLLCTSVNELTRWSVVEVASLTFDEEAVKHKCLDIYNSLWCPSPTHPRNAPSKGAAFSKYMSWFHNSTTDLQPHLHNICPTAKHRCLIRLRLGCWQLRCRDHTIPRHCRTCMLCDTNCIDDEQHVVFECPRFHRLRLFYHHLFVATDMHSFFNQPDQTGVLNFIHQIYKLRRALSPTR